MINKFKEKFLNKKFLTYVIIGVLNTISSQLLYVVFVYMMSPVLSSLLSDCLTMIISYFLNMKFTYHEKISLKSAVSFPLSYIPGFIINAIMVLIVVDLMRLPKQYAKIIAAPITVPVNYLCMSFIVKITSNNQSKK